jgi:arabinofuranan 3-O-arabinosyltransferase
MAVMDTGMIRTFEKPVTIGARGRPLANAIHPCRYWLPGVGIPSKLVRNFRTANWLTPERAWRWGIAFALLWVGLLVLDVSRHTTAGLTDRSGEQLGRDFINYWSGARLAGSGRAALAYDVDSFHAFQKTLLGAQSEFKIYSYPPIAMLLALPLSPLPFIPALLAWVIVGAGLCTSLISRLVGWRIAALTMIAAPADFLNLISGQNGFFTASLLGGGLLALNRRPVLAGLLFGLTAYKPQMGVLLPVALVAGGYWRAAAAATVTVVLLVTASAMLLGVESWVAFAGQMALQRELMAEDVSFWHRMPTTFAAMRAFGADILISYAVQMASSALAIASVVIAWRAQCAYGLKAASLLVAAFLITPYAWDYDMVILLFAAAWLLDQVSPTAVYPWERVVLAALVLLPLFMAPLTKLAAVQIGPIVLCVILILLVRRASAECRVFSSDLTAGGSENRQRSTEIAVC